MWALEEQSCIRPKNRGSELMISDFIDEYNGCLRLTDNEYARFRIGHVDYEQHARVVLRYGANRDGYWTSEKLIPHFDHALKLGSFKYPSSEYDVLWVSGGGCTHQ